MLIPVCAHCRKPGPLRDSPAGWLCDLCGTSGGRLMQFQLWVEVFDWYDGDTCHASVDLSSHVYLGTRDHPVRIRMSHINAPELSTKAGPAARDYAIGLVPPGRYPCVSTGLDNYGRPILDIHLPDGRLFSQAMLDAGQAVPMN